MTSGTGSVPRRHSANELERHAAILQGARTRAASGGACVLDVLLEGGTDEVAGLLLEIAGVEPLLDESRVGGVEQLQGIPGSDVLLLTMTDGIRCIAMRDPWNQRLFDQALGVIGRYVAPVAAGESLFRRSATLAAAPVPDASRGGSASAHEPSVVRFVDEAIRMAREMGASDVHFECDRDGVTAKLRLDGVMTTLAKLSDQQRAEEVISRIKVLAQLDITERRLPQDGRIHFDSGGSTVDLRVSIMPSVFGEDAVLRILDRSAMRSTDRAVSLDSLGFDTPSRDRIRTLARQPHGMVLITGPTGSGKTTTVYATLSEINSGTEKIITIEDPVEYELAGVLQIPVNERKGLTFAKGLRSILRHDPDRILVGEIRDAETAEIAVQSALTGHLVFTTVHANSVFDVIGRFRHFGIDMFGFVSALNGVVVQRLLRRLCKDCMAWRPCGATEDELFKGHGRASASTPRPVGCAQCRHTGYRGRFVVAEVHQMTDEFRDLVMSGADVTALKAAAFKGSARTLIQQGLDCVELGHTSVEELKRVVGQG